MPSGHAWVAQGDPLSTPPDALAVFCSSLPQPHGLHLSTQNPPPRTDQSNTLALGTSTDWSFSDLVQQRSGTSLCFIGDELI